VLMFVLVSEGEGARAGFSIERRSKRKIKILTFAFCVLRLAFSMRDRIRRVRRVDDGEA